MPRYSRHAAHVLAIFVTDWLHDERVATPDDGLTRCVSIWVPHPHGFHRALINNLRWKSVSQVTLRGSTTCLNQWERVAYFGRLQLNLTHPSSHTVDKTVVEQLIQDDQG